VWRTHLKTLNFSLRRFAKSEPHNRPTGRGYRGGSYHFCAFNFRIRHIVSPLGGAENVGENALPSFKPHKFGIHGANLQIWNVNWPWNFPQTLKISQESREKYAPAGRLYLNFVKYSFGSSHPTPALIGRNLVWTSRVWSTSHQISPHRCNVSPLLRKNLQMDPDCRRMLCEHLAVITFYFIFVCCIDLICVLPLWRINVLITTIFNR